MNWRHDSTITNASLLSGWVYGVLRPIVRILRSAGVTQASLLECVKRAGALYDGEAQKGRLGSGSRYESRLALRAVTAAWARSAAWTDDTGHARELSLRPDDARGFEALVRSVNPSLNAPAVLKELQSMEVVRILPHAKAVRLLREGALNGSEESFSVEPVLRDLQRFAETLEQHVFRDPSAPCGQIQMSAARLSIDPAQFDDFCRFATRNCQTLLDCAEDRLKSYRELPEGAGANYGVGVFVFFEDVPASQSYRAAGNSKKLR